MIISHVPTPFQSPSPDTDYDQILEISSSKTEISDLHGTITGFTYCLVFIVAVGVAAFVCVAAVASGDISGGDAETEIIGGKDDNTAAWISNKAKTTHRRDTKKPTRRTTTFAPNGAQVAAELIKAALDWNYPPCDDFYKFVCNRLTKSGTIWKQTDKTHITIKAMLTSTKVPQSGQRAAQKAAGLFQACVRLGSSAKTSEVKTLKRFFSKLGLDISKKKSYPNFDVPRRITQLSLEYGFPTLVKFGYFKVPRTFRKTLDMRINEEDEEWILMQHENNSDKQLEESYATDLGLYDKSLDSVALARRIILAEVIVLDAIRAIRQSSPWPIWTTVGELGRFTIGTTSEARWEWLIMNYTGCAFKAKDAVSIRDNATGLVQLLMDDARLRRDDSRLLMAWTLLHKLLPFASGEKMISLAEKKYGRQREAITNFCYDSISKVMALAASQRYFRKFVPQSALASAHRVTTEIIEALKTKINETDWVQGDAWCVMSDKAKYLRFTLGFPEGLGKESLVEAFYADFPNVGVNFFDAYLESHRLLTTRDVRGNVTAEFNVTDANAAYNHVEHAVNIFAGLLQPPVFINNGPASMNYGGLGQAIGHVIMHAYDAAAMSTDYLNRRIDLENSPTMEIHAAKTMCLRSSYKKAESASRVRARDDITDWEGLADYAGLVLAYAAYRNTSEDDQRAPVPSLTPEQAFFVSHCLKWCPGAEAPDRYLHGRSRCIVPLQNMPEFAKAFSCSGGDLMSPKSRCRFW